MARCRASTLSLLACCLAAPAGAREAVLARYDVLAGGMRVLAVEARFEFSPQGYRLRLASETTGVVTIFGRSRQVTLSEGRWRGTEAVPVRYRVEGEWRGVPRQVALDYAAPGQPVVLALHPPLEPDREPVPEGLRRGTMDGLSALATLSRTIAGTGRCDAVAAVYDGRRRVDYTARTLSQDQLPPGAGWSGEALRCGVESRVQAGFHGDEPRGAAARPQTGMAWIAPLAPGGMPLPVRVELPSRWFGTLRVQLVEARPVAPLTSVATGQD